MTHPAPGTPCWIDLTTPDRDAAAAFYCALLGWTVTEPDPALGGYSNFLCDGAVVAGLNAPMPGVPHQWSTWLSTPDADATMDAVTRHGGTVVMPVHTVGSLGRMAVFVDPTGAGCGLWEAGEHRGYDLRRPVGGVAWQELHTPDPDRAVAFYRDVFDCGMSTPVDSPEFRYLALHPGGADQLSRAGVLHGDAPIWITYFRVADVDAAVARLVELGGGVIEPAADSPWGRMAEVTDPQGVRFKLMDPGSMV